MAYERDSYIVSEYHRMFCKLGYPELDLRVYPDGETWVIQYYNRPIIPALTKWQTVLGPLRNVLVTESFIREWVEKLDITKKAFWAREEQKTREVEEEWDSVERQKVDRVERAHKAIMRNPNLVERMARNGIHEMDIPSLARHVPTTEVFKKTYKGVEQSKGDSHGPVTTVHSASEPAIKANDAGVAGEA